MPMDERYDPKKIEPDWQAEWDRTDLYLTREDPGRPKFYVLEMFPYPSGDGLSVGHLHNYVPCDVIGRYKRMAGLQRAARDGLGRLRPARRKRRAAQGTRIPRRPCRATPPTSSAS